MFLAYYLPGFLDLFAAVATDCETAAPFVFLLFDLVREPYLGSYLRQRTEHESLIQHQLSLLLAYVPGSLPKTTFKSVLQLDKWWRRVSSMCTLSLIFRTFLLHISVARGVANPIVPSEHTLALRDSLEGLIASLKLRLATPYDQRAILGARPSPRDAKEFSDLSRRANIAVEDTIDQLEALVPILRLKDGVDARTVFRLYKNDTQPKLYWEDVCVITPKEDEVQCKEGSLLTCSRVRL
ncbi:hypothetical protein BDY24DRAFT_369828 [Mrakia frigida]|uniref:uncharacterized protein n=1 Tax=Mrakia frigida TaxID=29902 RepID=UPI003FCC122E